MAPAHAGAGISENAVMSTDPDLVEQAKQLLETLRAKKLSVVTAESCTAGMLATLLSKAPGAAEHLHGGFITYTKANKTRALGVSCEVLARRGAVCREVAIAMAEGALARSPAQLAVAITGVAGPDPDEDNNPVGLVCIAVAREGHPARHLERRYGDIGRDGVRTQAIADALSELKEMAAQD